MGQAQGCVVWVGGPAPVADPGPETTGTHCTMRQSRNRHNAPDLPRGRKCQAARPGQAARRSIPARATEDDTAPPKLKAVKNRAAAARPRREEAPRARPTPVSTPYLSEQDLYLGRSACSVPDVGAGCPERSRSSGSSDSSSLGPRPWIRVRRWLKGRQRVEGRQPHIAHP